MLKISHKYNALNNLDGVDKKKCPEKRRSLAMLAEEEKTSKSAILIPQSRDLNRSPVVDSKHDFIALALLIRLYLVKERKKCAEI